MLPRAKEQGAVMLLGRIDRLGGIHLSAQANAIGEPARCVGQRSPARPGFVCLIFGLFCVEVVGAELEGQLGVA